MQKELQQLTNTIQDEYYDWTVKCAKGDLSDINKEMILEFNRGVSVEEGRKYFKILTSTSVWGFVMKEADKKFKAGDILKAASWAAPARNKARGNILDGGYTVEWTGPRYL
jgi:hypothetical protein